jgi:hypothetical protein
VSALAEREPHQTYPGLQEAIYKLLHGRPNDLFDLGRILRSFHGKPKPIMNYHLSQLKKKGLVENPKKGFWRALQAPTGIDHAAIRERVAQMPLRVVSGESGEFFKHEITRAVETETTTTVAAEPEHSWARFARLHAQSIKERSRSSAPAAELFTDADRELLDLLMERA